MFTSYDKHVIRKREVMRLMTYRELLGKCKEKPGWFRPMEYSDNEFSTRYKNWMIRVNEEYRKDEK